MLFAGGENPGGTLASAETFESAQPAWATGGLLNAGRNGHTVTLLSDAAGPGRENDRDRRLSPD